MLRLRKALLHDSIYYLILVLTIIPTLIRLNIPKKSNYNIKSKEVIGTVTYLYQDNEKINLKLKNKETLLLTYYTNNKTNLKLGDKIKVKATFQLPRSTNNKDIFNYKKYLLRRNIFYQIKPISIVKLSSSNNPYYLIKNIIIKRISNKYLYTFILGDKSYIDNNIIRSYQENSISHLFAISGMHITLLVELIKKILKKFNLTEVRIYHITSIFLFIYLLLVGLSPSILRGVLFYFLFTTNKIYYYYIKPLNLFILTLVISLIINPNYIYDVGFQYSYLISLSLISLSCNFNNTSYFKNLLKTSYTCFIVSIPISLYNFCQINLLSIIYNLFYVPLISIIIFPLSLLVFIFPKLNIIYNLLIIVLEKSSMFLSKISIGKIVFMKVPVIIYLVYLLLILLYIFNNNRKYLIILLCLIIIHFFIPYLSNKNYVKAIDVSQGDSTLLHINKKNILIDTGGNPVYDVTHDGEIYFNILNPTFKANGIKKLDYLILTHGDKDHMGEAKILTNNFKVDKVIFNCGEFNDLEKELIKKLNRKNIKYYSCIKELNIENNKLYFLGTKEYDNENDNSNVIYTELNGYKFMFMGDASKEREKDILDEYDISNIDVLKVGHHGSNTSSSKEFIKKMNPKYSIISVGKNNRYGHPNKEVLNNLSESRIYRTDLDGSIEFKIKNNKLKIETCSP